MEYPVDKTGIVDYISQIGSPVTAVQVCQCLVHSSTSSRVAAVEGALRDLVDHSRIFEHPAKQKNWKKRYWKISPVEALKSKLLSVLNQRKTPPTMSMVRKRVLSCEKGFFDEALGQLIGERIVFILRTDRTRYLLNRPPRPTEHLSKRQMADLKGIVKVIGMNCQRKLSLQDVINFLDGDGLPKQRRDSPTSEVSDLIFREWYEADLPRLRGAKSVPIPFTWQRYDSWCKSHNTVANLSYFHKRLTDLWKDGIVELTPHSGTEPICEGDRPLSIQNPRGEILYYWKWL